MLVYPFILTLLTLGRVSLIGSSYELRMQVYLCYSFRRQEQMHTTITVTPISCLVETGSSGRQSCSIQPLNYFMA
jgi:hypothetical protein